MPYTQFDHSRKTDQSEIQKLSEPSEIKGIGKRTYCNERKFIAHPEEFPITYRQAVSKDSANETLDTNPYVGLSFEGDVAVEAGTVLDVTIRLGYEKHTFQGQVVCVHSLDQRYEFGLCFTREEDAFRLRNLEQVCHIEIYRRRLCEINACAIDIDIAAREWIERHSARFPKLFPDL